MANRFNVWDEIAQNTQTWEEFRDDAQRLNGFQAGNAASSIRVNSALRQANIVACALMNAIAPNDNTIDLNSAVADVQNIISTYFAGLGRTITLNGTINTAPTFYAPTAAPNNSAGKLLKSNGQNNAPTWVDGSRLEKIRIYGGGSTSGLSYLVLTNDIATVFANNCDVKLTLYFTDTAVVNASATGGITVYGRATKRKNTSTNIDMLYITFQTFGGSAVDANNDYPMMYELRAYAEYGNGNQQLNFTCKQISFHNTTSSPYTITDVSDCIAFDHDRFLKIIDSTD